MKKLMQCVILLVLPCLIVGTAFGRKIKVPKHYPTIQAAIDAASEGDIVEVSDGIYTGSGDKNLNFGGKNITVRSENGPNNTIIDCLNEGRAFYFHNGETEDAVVDGFTIIPGYDSGGGGIRIEDSNPTITGCIFAITDTECSLNVGYYDSVVIYNNNSSPTIKECTFTKIDTACFPGNSSLYNSVAIYNNNSSPTIKECTFTNLGFGIFGVGNCIYNDNSSPTITKCTFQDNRNLASYGVGIRNSNNSSPTITDCTFTNNTTYEGGGGIYNSNSDPIITNCTFSNNYAELGGGAGIYNNSSSLIITNSAFIDNIGDEGGAGAIGDFSSSSIIDNCEFFSNRGSFGGGAIISWNSSLCSVSKESGQI